MTEYTDLQDVADNFFTCRLLWSHAWEKNPSPQNIDGEIAKYCYAMMCLRCVRCGRERYDYLGATGDLIGRYYKNPNGYPKLRRYAADTLRAETIRRSLLIQRRRGRKATNGS